MSIMKVVAMTIGEIEYTRFFTDQPLFSPVLSRVVFLVFCVMMPIVLMNLTVLFSSEFTCSFAENFILNPFTPKEAKAKNSPKIPNFVL